MSLNQSKPSIEQISEWLAGIHHAEIIDLVSLSSGFWSSAYAYRVGTQDFVLRFGNTAEWFAIDKAATRFQGPNLPIPNVVEIGEALGRHYAISERHFGRFIETTAAGEGRAVGKTLETLLAAMRSVAASQDDGVVWYDQEGSTNMTWHRWLKGGLVDNPEAHVHGWRMKLAEQPVMDDLFKRCESRIHDLLPACPERRDLVHGDLLHQNVLVSEDASRVTAIFSWKCSAKGDFLYDVAWCTFWSGWHPGIAAADIWKRTIKAPDLDAADLLDAPLRHHCYELQIGASHLGWNVWTGNQEALEQVARALEHTLEKGPLPMHRAG